MAVMIHQTSNSRGNYNFNACYYENLNLYYHFHSNYEIIYVVSGQVQAVIDNREETLPEGSFALILPNQLHSLTTMGDSAMWIWVFSEEYVYHFASRTKNLEGKISGFFCDPLVRRMAERYLIEEATEDIDMRKACFYAICSEFGRCVELRPKTKGNETLYQQIVDYVSNRFREPVSMKGMAEEMGYDYHYISRVFHNLFHMNFRSFVNQYRINYARELLIQGELNIIDIAYESGFQSVRSFNDVYKKLTGSVPSCVSGHISTLK